MKTKAEQRAFLERTLHLYETGKPIEIRRARREFEDEWRADPELCAKHSELIFAALARFDAIPDAAHQAALIAGIDLCFFSLADEHFTVLRDFILKAIQHPDVRVRDAALRTSEWLDRSVRRRAKSRQEEIHGRALEEYKDYVSGIELLLDYFDDGSETDARYIDEMKPSPQRSLEMLLDRVTHGGYELEITHIPPPAILAKREELETKIVDLLESVESDFCLHDVLEEIYREEGREAIDAIIEMFEGEGEGLDSASADRLEVVTAVVNDAWRYFPHASLDGRCPAEN